MEEPKILKTIIPIDCPHCAKTICIGFQSMIPTLTSAVTMKEVKEAKDEVIKRLDEIKFKKKDEKGKIVEWLNRETTLIDGGDVESILKQVIIEQFNDNTEQNQTN